MQWIIDLLIRREREIEQEPFEPVPLHIEDAYYPEIREEEEQEEDSKRVIIIDI